MVQNYFESGNAYTVKSEVLNELRWMKAMAKIPDTSTDASKSKNTEIDCYCPLGGVMDLLSRRYAMQVICIVGAIGPARYGDIENAFGDVSSSTLSTRLDDFVKAGYLSREQYAEIPPRVEYELTDKGDELREKLGPLLEWVDEQEPRGERSG
ncbi:winged helix-turn-helix transcriptional regulator [Halomarina pelagica]|uniref:winged helix-turn-helix transcriptional regulator n=1 Tax=Halomarina pelagica TaxID=2961599 RepID=UPI0020C32E45|nr:helix-turn-helix domain-containing protein [Halomarina sp. BND7]